MNFSRWPEYGPAGQGQLLMDAAERIRGASMPPSRYLQLHPEARLSDQEKAHLIATLERESARVLPPAQPSR